MASPKARRKKQIIIYIFAGCILVIFALIMFAQQISDEIEIKSANPAIIELAQQAGMSKKGELIFLRTNPQLVSDTQMETVCSSNAAANNSSGFIEQGCYIPATNRIFIRQMPSDLYSLEVSTAAYEMLHPVYLDIESSTLNKSIESNYQEINDSFLNSQVANFAKTEPGYQDLELFSLLGTGYTNLSSGMANYYSPYFNDISDTIDANNKVTQLFQSDQTDLNNLQASINTYSNDANTEYGYATTAYNNSVSWANVGNQEENDYNYNIYTQDYNQYSNFIDSANTAINNYNQILQSYNELITEYNGTQPINQLQTVQTQTQ